MTLYNKQRGPLLHRGLKLRKSCLSGPPHFRGNIPARTPFRRTFAKVGRYEYPKKVEPVRLYLTLIYNFEAAILSLMKQNRQRTIDQWQEELPIFSDFAICDSREEITDFVESTGLSTPVFRQAQVWDSALRKMRTLVYSCPECCPSLRSRG